MNKNDCPNINKDNYTDLNSATISKWVDEGWEWGVPVDSETCSRARSGDWNVLLTPTKPVPHCWFSESGEIAGMKILGLASGGGQQMPIFSCAGAECTVLDYSERQIQSEISISRREGYAIRTIRADMTKPLPFSDGEFDLIFHPVSNCYVKDVYPIWRECYRVLKKGGRLLAGLDNGINFIVNEDEERIVNRLPFDPLGDEKLLRQSLVSDDGVQFSHSIEEQIGGQIAAGFVIRDLYSDTNGYGRLHELGIPTFWATFAEKL